MIKLLLFLMGFVIFFGSLALSGWCYENCIEVSEWWHDLVGFMELPLFGLVFVAWMIMLVVGGCLMSAICEPDEPERKKE